MTPLSLGRLQTGHPGRSSGVHAPRGNRHMDALAVRSLQDLVDTVNAEEIASIYDDGVIHICGAHDDSRGEAVRSMDTCVIRRGSGCGASPGHLEVTSTKLIEGTTNCSKRSMSRPRAAEGLVQTRAVGRNGEPQTESTNAYDSRLDTPMTARRR